jgi:hypothetical protein
MNNLKILYQDDNSVFIGFEKTVIARIHKVHGLDWEKFLYLFLGSEDLMHQSIKVLENYSSLNKEHLYLAIFKAKGVIKSQP